MPEYQETKKKMSVTEAWAEIKNAWNLGVTQGKDLIRLREAYKVIIASRIRTVRMSAGMTQEEVSTKINTNTLTYRGYENCKSDIPIVYLIRIADLFDVSMDYLTGRTENNGTANPALEERISRLEKELNIHSQTEK